MKDHFLSKLFDKRPIQWGLRGDPYLWDEMKTKMENIKIPATTEEFEKTLNTQFKELTGQDLKREKNIFVSKYSKGGMSSGVVCSDFWIDTAFPLIVQRYKELVQ